MKLIYFGFKLFLCTLILPFNFLLFGLKINSSVYLLKYLESSDKTILLKFDSYSEILNIFTSMILIPFYSSLDSFAFYCITTWLALCNEMIAYFISFQHKFIIGFNVYFILSGSLISSMAVLNSIIINKIYFASESKKDTNENRSSKKKKNNRFFNITTCLNISRSIDKMYILFFSSIIPTLFSEKSKISMDSQVIKKDFQRIYSIFLPLGCIPSLAVLVLYIVEKLPRLDYRKKEKDVQNKKSNSKDSSFNKSSEKKLNQLLLGLKGVLKLSIKNFCWVFGGAVSLIIMTFIRNRRVIYLNYILKDFENHTGSFLNSIQNLMILISPFFGFLFHTVKRAYYFQLLASFLIFFTLSIQILAVCKLMNSLVVIYINEILNGIISILITGFFGMFSSIYGKILLKLGYPLFSSIRSGLYVFLNFPMVKLAGQYGENTGSFFVKLYIYLLFINLLGFTSWCIFWFTHKFKDET